MKLSKNLAVAVLLSGTAMSLAQKSFAQSARGADSTGSPNDIVVTAQKRDTTVQKTPLSITAVTGESLQARGVTGLAALAQGTPGVSLKSEGPSQTEIEMRGMTSSGGQSATVGFYLDDIPLTGSPSAQNGHVVIDPDLYDLNRIEMLRGPQGTLFGSGSMGGTVRLITNQPNLSEYHASVGSILSGAEGGSFNHNDNFMVNLPLVQDKLALRIVGTENFTSGWINRIVDNPYPAVSAAGTSFVSNPAAAPIEKQYPGANAYQIYSTRATLLWTPTDNLSISPALFYEYSLQNGPNAYDGISATNNRPIGGMTQYEPFDIAEPLNDRILAVSLNVNYSYPLFDIKSSTAYWTRQSKQTQDDSQALSNPNAFNTMYANYGARYPGQGYYGPSGSGQVASTEIDPSRQLSEELRFTSKGDKRLNWVAGLYFSNLQSAWNFQGTTPNFASYADAGTGQAATTSNWLHVHAPIYEVQTAIFGDATYKLTDKLKIDVGARVTNFLYHYSDCHSGWGSALGDATPSCTGLVRLGSDSFNPKLNISYNLSPNLMAYASVASGFRPGGGNPVYPTTFGTWLAAFQKMNYTGSNFPSTYKPDSVWSYELGEKARLLHNRLTVNASIYYEDWHDIQLEAWPANWALGINGKQASVYGAEVDVRADLGAGFDLQVSGGYVHDWLDGGVHWDIPPLHVLPEVAPESGTAILTYTRPVGEHLSFTAKLENSFTGPRYTNAFPVPNNAYGQYEQMHAYDLTNIRAGILSDKGWSVAVFVNNIFNKHAQLETLWMEAIYSSTYNRIVTNQPLTGGIDLSRKF